jgi:hypothetical protein
VWSLDGTTKIDHTSEETFAQIKKTSKHKLSPTEENESKKIKTETESLNMVEELNKRISERAGDLNCEDTRTEEEMRRKRIFCGMIENPNMDFEVIEKCDSIGKELANILISKGALDVMKVTQDFIRNSITKS